MLAIVNRTADGRRAGTETVARLTDDELDMRCGPPGCDGYTQLENVIRGFPNDGRALYANYGKGVLLWESQADAARWLNGTPAFGRYQDIVSTDLYWHTDPNQRNMMGEPWMPEGERQT